MEKQINKVAVSLEEKKQLLVEILNAVSDFCEKKGLRCYLTGGTLLGAVRHHGFIPWDDDIDVEMPRKDYDIFVSEFNKDRQDRFKLICSENTDSYYVPFAKVVDTSTVLKEDISDSVDIGLNVDVFPLENLPDTIDETLALNRKIRFYRKLLAVKNIKSGGNRAFYKNFALCFFKTLTFPISRTRIIKKIESMSASFKENDNSPYVAALVVMTYGQGEILERKIFESTEYLEFEGRQYACPGGYHEFLTHLYGDYMQLPPEEKRVTHHASQCWKIVEN